MAHCPDCGEPVERVVPSEAETTRAIRGATVWECPHCGAILGVSGSG